MPEPHAHFSPALLIFMLAGVVFFLGTAHLLALGSDSRASRALIALGF